MRRVLIAGAAFTAVVAAQALRARTVAMRAAWPSEVTAPYAPSPEAVPYVSLGYRELGADLMWMRVLAYLGGTTDTADGIAALVDATLALDDHFKRAYDGGLAIESATHGITNQSHLDAIAVLERAMAVYPDDWKYPFLAGQIYVADMITDDPVQKRAWTEKGVLMLERAVRLPETPPTVAALAAHLQETLGRHEAAIQTLRDKIMLTDDPGAQKILFDKLAKLEQADAAELAIAMLDDRRHFLAEWQRSRKTIPATMFVILGPRRNPYAAPAELAVDRDLIGTYVSEPVEPLM